MDFSFSPENASRHAVIGHHAERSVGCIDGEMSRLIVTTALLKAGYREENIKHIALKQHNRPHYEDKMRRALLERPGADAFCVDYSLSRPFLDWMMSTGIARSFTGTDHHDTAQDDMEGYDPPSPPSVLTTEFNYRVEVAQRSCSLMLWKKYFPGEPVLPFVRMIDRMDGNATGLDTEEARAASIYIDHCYANAPLKQALRTLRQLMPLSLEEMAGRGYALIEADGRQTLKVRDQEARAMISNEFFAELPLSPGAAPLHVPLVKGNIRDAARWASILLIEMGRKHGTGIAGAFSKESDGGITLKLRSNGTPHVAQAIASLKKKWGLKEGGGGAGGGALYFPPGEFEKHVRLTRQKPLPAQAHQPRRAV